MVSNGTIYEWRWRMVIIDAMLSVMLKPNIELSEFLSPGEREEFAKRIHVVRTGASAIVESGRALTLIRDKRLYRERFPSFEKFVDFEFRMSKSYAYRLISGFKEVESLAGTIKPSSEAVVRELKKVPRPSKQEVWNRALKISQHPTANVVRAAAEISLEPDHGREEREFINRLKSANSLLRKPINMKGAS